MKALWAFEPFHQDKTRIKGMHNTLSLLAGSPSKVEVGFVVTRTEFDNILSVRHLISSTSKPPTKPVLGKVSERFIRVFLTAVQASNRQNLE